MSWTLCHAAGNMFRAPKDRERAYRLAAANGDVFTTTEAQKDHDFLASLPGFKVVTAVELAIGWRTDRFTLVDSGSAMVMAGGKHGDGQHKADKRRRGPNRYVLWAALTEVATGQLWLICDYHTAAKIDTTAIWRVWLWNQDIKNAAVEVKRAQALHPGAQTVAVGDFNRKRTVDLRLGLTEVKTPATLGKALRYDRVQTDPDVRASGVKTLATGLDHKALIVRLSVMGATPTPVPTPTPGGIVPRSVEDALAWTRNRGPIPDKNGNPVGAAGWCKRETRLAYGVPSDGSPDASTAWGRTKFKHTDGSEPPRGAVCWYLGGRSGHGHVCPAAGGDNIRTTDLPTSGRWGDAKRTDPVTKWGLRYVGWSEDIDGVRVIHTAPPEPPPTRLQPSAYKMGATGPHVAWLGRRLVRYGSSITPSSTYTSATKSAVAAFQRKQGWSGSDADGFPGAETLARLSKPAPKKAARPKPKPVAKATLSKGDKVVDYSFARPSPAALKAAGFTAVVRYLSQEATDTVFSKKDLTASEVKALAKVGLGIICIWETTAGRATEGRAAGVADAKAAEAQAAALGLPAGQPIYYAVDKDATAAAVRPYFNGVKATGKRPTEGCYGGVKIADGNLATYIWQTEAWSSGKVSAKAHMIQRIHPTLKVKGSTAWDENDVLKPIPVWRP